MELLEVPVGCIVEDSLDRWRYLVLDKSAGLLLFDSDLCHPQKIPLLCLQTLAITWEWAEFQGFKIHKESL